MVGAAVWRPPEAEGPTDLDREREAATERRVRDIDNEAAEALFAGFAVLEPGHPAEPHWYLFFVPAWQGHGFGSILLEPVLKLADQSQTLCYLETPFPRTHVFYRRLGYEITRAGNPFVGAPTLWAMTRLPQ